MKNPLAALETVDGPADVARASARLGGERERPGRSSTVTTIIACGITGLLMGGQAFAAQILLDPGMNLVGANGQVNPTPNAPWVVTATRGVNQNYSDGAASEVFADHDGGGFGLFFKAFTGNPPWDPTAGAVDAQIYQDVAGTAGNTYTLTGWWGAENNYSGFATAGANAIFALEFFGINGLIASVELDLEAAGLGDPATFGLDYEQYQLSAVAPIGTTTVRARGSMIDGVFFLDPGQALVTDDWSLSEESVTTVVPEPATGGLTALALLGVVLRTMRQRKTRA